MNNLFFIQVITIENEIYLIYLFCHPNFVNVVSSLCFEEMTVKQAYLVHVTTIVDEVLLSPMNF